MLHVERGNVLLRAGQGVLLRLREKDACLAQKVQRRGLRWVCRPVWERSGNCLGDGRGMSGECLGAVAYRPASHADKVRRSPRQGSGKDQRMTSEAPMKSVAEPWPAPAAGERPGLSCLKMRRFRKDLQGFHFQNGGHVARSLDALPPRCRSAGFPDIRGCGLPMDQGSEARDQGRREPP